jgi:ferredoxin-NADP reductase
VGRFWQTAQRILDEMMARPDGEGWMAETIRQHHARPQVVPMSYLRSMMMAILAAAHETTSKAAANAFMTLFGHRPAWEAICENPALIPNAVEECLRVAGSIIALRRIATADTVVGGVPIAQGGKVLVVQASANMDPRHFENPDEVDLYRENAVEHLTCGYGAHQCMGKNIGRMQMRVFLEEFVRRLPHIRLVGGQRFDFLANTSFRGPAELWVEWDPASNPERRPGAPLPAWTAGAHVDLIAGGFRRKYSLCGPADDASRLEVVVQRDAEGRGGSRHFCDRLQPGETLRLSGPKNPLRLDESAQRYALLAAGIGITPIAAMADRLKLLAKPYRIHDAGRSRQRMALLERLLRDHAGCLAVHVKDEGQRMHLPALASGVDAGTRAYACGPDRLIDELETLAASWPEGVLRFEHFHAPGRALDPAIEHGFVAELRDSSVRVEVAADQTLLQALQAAGIDLPCDCGEGLCGTCEVAIVEGKADHRDKVLSQAERAAQNRMMACCSRAAGKRIVLAL